MSFVVQGLCETRQKIIFILLGDKELDKFIEGKPPMIYAV